MISPHPCYHFIFFSFRTITTPWRSIRPSFFLLTTAQPRNCTKCSRRPRPSDASSNIPTRASRLDFRIISKRRVIKEPQHHNGRKVLPGPVLLPNAAAINAFTAALHFPRKLSCVPFSYKPEKSLFTRGEKNTL